MQPSDDDMFDVGDAGNNMKTALEPLVQDCNEAVEIHEQIKMLEDSLKALKSRLHVLRTQIIPDKMAEAGIGDTFSTESGYKLKISQLVIGGLPKAGEAVLEDDDPREIALLELSRLGGDSLIKNLVQVSFDKGENEKAQTAFETLKNLGYDAEVQETVNTMSYRAFIREAFNGNQNPDLTKLGVDIMPQVKITPPKG